MNLESLFNLPPPARRLLLVIGDTLAVLVAVWASFAIRLGEWWPDMLQEVVWLFPLAVLILIPTLTLIGLYRPMKACCTSLSWASVSAFCCSWPPGCSSVRGWCRARPG